MEEIAKHGLVLLGCGKMGSAMLAGWLARGLPPQSVHVIDPHPSEQLKIWQSKGVHLNKPLPAAPAVCVLAVKPQMMGDALPQVRDFAATSCLFLSIAAGTTLAALADHLGDKAGIIRAMPNTPASVGQGITAYCGNEHAGDAGMAMARLLLEVVGKTIALEREAQMDAVTALSGSGPAYVFHLIEAMAEAGKKLGLPSNIADMLALETVAGAGALAASSAETAAKLRENVTSPGGTTAAALEILMGAQGLRELMEKAMSAARDRSEFLGK